MNHPVFISICIPAYKHVEYLKRLLDSIAAQSFRDFEIIITDDSKDDTVEVFLQAYKSIALIRYHKNEVSLGSPENWNAGIRLAKGTWIKIMHDDDWFAHEHALAEFASAAKQLSKASFIFSGFSEVNLNTGKARNFVISNTVMRLLRKNELLLFKQNYIGHPSTTLIRNTGDYYFDKRFKWVVDIEFYIRYLRKHKNFVAIRKPLIKIGVNEHQITKQAFRNPEVEIPEVLGLLQKLPPEGLHNIFVYDYYWRFIRNLSIRSINDIEKYAHDVAIPAVIVNMISAQARWPLSLLKNGLVSKSLMFTSYLRYRL